MYKVNTSLNDKRNCNRTTLKSAIACRRYLGRKTKRNIIRTTSTHVHKNTFIFYARKTFHKFNIVYFFLNL